VYGDDRRVQTPRWSDVADLFVPDGGLLDIYVFGTNVEEWEKVIATVATQGWQVGFSATGWPGMPDVREIFAQLDDLSVCVSVQPVAGLVINTHFFTEEEIEFDLEPSDVRGQTDFDALCTFLRVVARAAGKPIVLTPENSGHLHLLAYDPGTDGFVVRPD
jgi:hypothetical protein